jgi:hypothetical protein
MAVQQSILSMSEQDKAYLAGIIDGEGCITISRGVHKKQNNNVYYQAVLHVANTDKRMIDWIIEITGLGSYHRGKHHPPRKVWYRWAVRSAAACEVVRTVYPYLVCKQRQADVLLELGEEVKVGPGRGYRLSPETTEYRDRLYQILKNLHRR